FLRVTPSSVMNQVLKSAIAFLLSPLIPILGISISLGGFADILVALPFVAFFAYMITILIALPLYGVMLYKKWLTWWHFALFGVLPALSINVWSALTDFLSSGNMVSLTQGQVHIIVDGKRTIAGYIYLFKQIVFYSLMGVGAGLAFWALAHRKKSLTNVSN
ncbi:hypothetical protein KO528_01320, partial [Saccharophagus degradans]|uniref:hypothetical protein n=1 Tax=Saccharophagus degradans TaxID=86304 RepID=UPI001C082B6E